MITSLQAATKKQHKNSNHIKQENKFEMPQTIKLPSFPPHLGKIFQVHFWRGGGTIPTPGASGDPVTSWKLLPPRGQGPRSKHIPCMDLHTGIIIWNLKIHPWKRKNIFQSIIFRFLVNFSGVYNGFLVGG